LRSGSTRKRIENRVALVDSFEVVDQVAERYARPEKHGRAAQSIRTAVNNRRSAGRVNFLILTPHKLLNFTAVALK